MASVHRLERASIPAVRGRNGGFTLVEIVISIVLLGILAAVGSSMISDSATVANITNLNQTSLSQSRYAVERLAREIREVRLVNNAYDINISTSPATNLTFTKSDGVVVSITQSGMNLTLGYPSSSSALTNEVESFSLSFFAIDGTTTVLNNTDVRFVQITLTTKNNATGVTSTQRTRVALRNAPGPVGI